MSGDSSSLSETRRETWVERNISKVHSFPFLCLTRERKEISFLLKCQLEAKARKDLSRGSSACTRCTDRPTYSDSPATLLSSLSDESILYRRIVRSHGYRRTYSTSIYMCKGSTLRMHTCIHVGYCIRESPPPVREDLRTGRRLTCTDPHVWQDDGLRRRREETLFCRTTTLHPHPSVAKRSWRNT